VGSGASASCSVTYTPERDPPSHAGAPRIRSPATYSGDSTHSSSSGSHPPVKVLSITLLARGSFVIDDQKRPLWAPASPSGGPQWSASSTRSPAGRRRPASRALPARSPHNPAAVARTRGPPQPGKQLAAARHGARAHGGDSRQLDRKVGARRSPATVVKVVVVRTNPGYEPNPGHPGTGTVVGQVCP